MDVVLQVTHIKFDHTPGDTADGIDIRENNSTDISVPEWIKGGQNKPAAYKKDANVTIKARFTVSPASVTSAKIRAITSSSILGNLGEQTVNFSDGISNPEYVTFTPANSAPNSVNKDTVTWQWKMRDINGNGSSECNVNSSGPHTIYTVLATPQSPMAEPWTEVLDYACVWADEKTTNTDVAEKITQKIYSDIGGSYDTYEGAPQYTSNGTSGIFSLTLFLNKIPNIGTVNCYDCGKSLTIFANAVGCGLDYKFSSPFGYLNCIKPIGKGWANNPFYDNPNYSSNPIVGEDDDINDGRSGFGNHVFSGISSNIYDATLKADTDDNPDAPPHVETWMTGESWNSYKTKVVDDNPYTATGSPINYSFSVQ